MLNVALDNSRPYKYIYTLVTELVDVRSEQVADISNDRDREQYLILKILIVCSSQT
jgi:hypothetical protein